MQEYRRPIGLQVIEKKRFTIIYYREHVFALARMHMKVDNIHFSGYMTCRLYLDIICQRPGLQSISMPPHQLARLIKTRRWRLLAPWIKSFLVMNKFVKKFWTRSREMYVRGMMLQGVPTSAVAGQIEPLLFYNLQPDWAPILLHDVAGCSDFGCCGSDF